MTIKPRILLTSEYHKLNSGYSTYGCELLTRLHNTGKYEIAELAQWADPADPGLAEAPWKVYGNLPYGASYGKANEEEVNRYHSSPLNEFGAWNWEKVCLDFQPHLTFVYSDWWYFEFQDRSPFRHLYKWLVQPTVDAECQDEQWLSTYASADGVLTYSDWSTKVLEKEGGGQINLLGAASPGVDLNIFRPIANKRQHKERYGIDPDALIVGTVMRNQPRKKFAELIEAFSTYLKSGTAASKRAYLYLHSSFPDLAHDFPRLIKRSGVSGRIYITYFCHKCSEIVPQPYKDVRSTCPNCGSHDLCMTNTRKGLDRAGLASIYNLFDVYVQYANSEATGIPQLEAGACGVPLMAINYSGMQDIVEKLKGIPIKYLKLVCEPDFGCYRAIPDDEDFIQKLDKFLSLPESMKNKRRIEIRQLVQKHYSSDDNASKWEKAIDSFELRSKWNDPPRIHQPPTQYPNLPDDQFVSWAIINVLGRPEFLNSHMHLRALRDLQWGTFAPGMAGFYHNEDVTSPRQMRRPFDKNELVRQFLQMVEHNNNCERYRHQMIKEGKIK